MRYLVSRRIENGSYFEVASFVRRWQAERYAEQESGLSGFNYTVEDTTSGLLLSEYRDGKKALFTNAGKRNDPHHPTRMAHPPQS
jgi:hypothetical protein